MATTVARTVAAATVAATAVTTSSVAVASLSPAQVAAKRAAAARAAAAARVMRIRVSAVTIAKSRVGSRYSAGHSRPARVRLLGPRALRRAQGDRPHACRTTPRRSSAPRKRVAKKNLRPGDLVFFFRHGAHHVGVYIGHGRMVSATNPRGGVKIDSVFSGWYGSRYSGAGRLV